MERAKRLFDAVEAGASSTVFAILDANPEAIEAVGDGNANRRDKTPLMFALQCQRFGLARALIERGADVHARMPGGAGSSVIALAARFGIAGRDDGPLLAVVEALLDAGADPNEGLGPACHAYSKAFDQPRMIELLLRRGADPDRPAGSSGITVRELVRVNAARYSSHVLGLFGIAM